MTAAKATEYRIIRQLLHRDQDAQESPVTALADRLIAVLAATAGIFLLGAYLQELLWVVIGVVTVMALGASDD